MLSSPRLWFYALGIWYHGVQHLQECPEVADGHIEFHKVYRSVIRDRDRAESVAAIPADPVQAGESLRLCEEVVLRDAKEGVFHLTIRKIGSIHVSRAVWIEAYRKARTRNVTMSQ